MHNWMSKDSLDVILVINKLVYERTNTKEPTHAENKIEQNKLYIQIAAKF